MIADIPTSNILFNFGNHTQSVGARYRMAGKCQHTSVVNINELTLVNDIEQKILKHALNVFIFILFIILNK